MFFRKAVILGLGLMMLSACSSLNPSQDKNRVYFTDKEYREAFDKELHSKKEFPETVRIELEELDYLDLESLDSLIKERELTPKTFTLTKSYKNIREITNDKIYLESYLNEDSYTITVGTFVYKNNKALIIWSGRADDCVGVGLDLLELDKNHLKVISFGGTSYDVMPVTVFEQEPVFIPVEPIPK